MSGFLVSLVLFWLFGLVLLVPGLYLCARLLHTQSADDIRAEALLGLAVARARHRCRAQLAEVSG